MDIFSKWKILAVAMAAGLTCFIFLPGAAVALISDNPPTNPPYGWNKLCSVTSINVTPQATARAYDGTGRCWINTAQDKADGNQQKWTYVPVTVRGSYDLNSNRFTEMIRVEDPSGAKQVSVNGACGDDPWATKATCMQGSYATTSIGTYFGWNISTAPGPLSRQVFSADLIQAMLAKEKSNPPAAPVNVVALRWPVEGGKSEIGNIKWGSGLTWNNQWVLRFDIEYANYVDATFTKTGQEMGPGPKSGNAKSAYLFVTPFALQKYTDYFFRVCAVNDAGRQCSAPVKARPPTQMELASVASSIHPTAGMLGSAPAGRPPTAPPGAKSGSGGFGAALTGNRGGTTGSGTTGGAGGFGSQRPALVARAAPTTIGGAAPGASARPDLAVAREGILINDRTTAWNTTTRLVLHPDASHTCPVRVAFRYTNLGKAAAANVMAEIHDSLQPASPIATNNVASLASGQFGTVSGIAKVNAASTETKVTVTALVHENGTTMPDANMANNRGSVTLEVLCQANGAAPLTPAGHAPTAIGVPGAKRLGGVR